MSPRQDSRTVMRRDSQRPPSLPAGVHLGACPQRSQGRHLRSFGWYGGKFNHLDWLLPLLPAAHHYCEPFGGSAAVLLNREPSLVETFNDLDGDVVNFFRVLREGADEVIRLISLTPFS